MSEARELAQGVCRRLDVSSATHLFDLAAKAWLLPFVAQMGGAPEMWELIQKMRLPNRDERPSFSYALQLLDELEAERRIPSQFNSSTHRETAAALKIELEKHPGGGCWTTSDLLQPHLVHDGRLRQSSKGRL